MNLHDPLTAILVIMGVAFIMNLISNILNKYLVYTPDYIEKKKFISTVRKEYMEATKRKDEKQLKKLEKKIQSMKKMEAEISMKAFRPLIFTFGLFWLMWWWLSGVYGEMGAFIVMPIPLPYLGSALNFFGWYILASFWFGVLLRKLLLPDV